MYRSIPLLCLAFALVGCQPAGDQAAAPAETPAVEAPAPAAEPAADLAADLAAEPTPEPAPVAQGEAATVTPGMTKTQVRDIKGVPDSTRHEHGAGSEEIDLWVYGEETIRFSNGVVVE